MIFVVLIEWRRDLLIVYVLIFVIFCDFLGSGLFEREQRQREIGRASGKERVAGGRRKDERGERRENPTVYYLIIKGFQQCFLIHWKTLLKLNEES
jgi:hypothetical protein